MEIERDLDLGYTEFSSASMPSTNTYLEKTSESNTISSNMPCPTRKNPELRLEKSSELYSEQGRMRHGAIAMRMKILKGFNAHILVMSIFLSQVFPPIDTNWTNSWQKTDKTWSLRKSQCLLQNKWQDYERFSMAIVSLVHHSFWDLPTYKI